MQPLAYRTRHFWRFWLATGVMSAVCLLMGVAAAFYVALLPHIAERIAAWPGSWRTAPLMVCLAIIALTVFAGRKAYRLTDPERNYLRLDEAGLTYMRGGKTRFWPWRETSTFEHGPSRDRKGQINFAVRGPGTADASLEAEADMAAAGGTAGGGAEPRSIVIADAYETPLEEIVERLNDFRTRNVHP